MVWQMGHKVMHGGWRHNVDPVGENTTDEMTGGVSTKKELSGLKLMKPERLLKLQASGVSLSEAEEQAVAEYLAAKGKAS